MLSNYDLLTPSEKEEVMAHKKNNSPRNKAPSIRKTVHRFTGITGVKNPDPLDLELYCELSLPIGPPGAVLAEFVRAEFPKDVTAAICRLYAKAKRDFPNQRLDQPKVSFRGVGEALCAQCRIEDKTINRPQIVLGFHPPSLAPPTYKVHRLGVANSSIELTPNH